MELTKHAAQAMTERVIALEWVEKAVTEPELRIPDPNDPDPDASFGACRSAETKSSGGREYSCCTLAS